MDRGLHPHSGLSCQVWKPTEFCVNGGKLFILEEHFISVQSSTKKENNYNSFRMTSIFSESLWDECLCCDEYIHIFINVNSVLEEMIILMQLLILDTLKRTRLHSTNPSTHKIQRSPSVYRDTNFVSFSPLKWQARLTSDILSYGV